MMHMMYILNLIYQSYIQRYKGDKEIGGYLQKFQTMVGKMFFTSYVNSVESKINGSDLICAPCVMYI
jgi:hypothetical protein